jgi:flagellin
MWFHMGANMHQRERVYIGTMTAQGLNLIEKTGKFLANLSTAGGANRAIGVIDDALHKIAKQRADLGAYYNRLEYAAKGLMTAYENIRLLKAGSGTLTWQRPW